MKTLVPADAQAADALVAEAGWNQIRTDWTFLIRYGICKGVVDGAGRLVATGAILPHGERIGWICMVLVAGAWRRRGIASELLRRAIAEAERIGLTPGLDATEAGRHVYLPLGFRDVYEISRLEAPSGQALTGPVSPGVRPMTHKDISQVIRLDAAILGAPRDHLLVHLLDRVPGLAWVVEAGGRITGFCAGRDGRDADQVGPIVAAGEADAKALLVAANSGRADPRRRIYLDVADRHGAFQDWLKGLGFARQRGFTRMIKGRVDLLGDPRSLYAIAGPEMA